MGFADLQKHIQQVVAPLEGALLNSHPFFATIQPTTENLARVLFDKIDVRLGQLGVLLRELSVWETPTRGTVVTRDSSRQMINNQAPERTLVPHLSANGDGATSFILVPMDQAFPELNSPPGAFALLPQEAFQAVAQQPPTPPSTAAVSPNLTALPDEAPEEPDTPPTLVADSPPSPPEAIAEPQPDDSPPPPSMDPYALAAQSLAQVAATAIIEDESGSLAMVPRGGRRRRAPRATVTNRPQRAVALPWQSVLTVTASLVLILAATVLIYGRLLAAPTDTRFPWGSDTWGHLWKAEYLLERLQTGDVFPRFTASWYNGIEPFRYWAPLPYYLLLGLRLLTGDIFRAGHLFVVLSALFGSISWLAFRRHLGWVGATGAALVWLVWPDHMRVSFSEGNLPRVLGTAMAPLIFYTFLQVLESQRPRMRHILGLIGLMHLVVLSHAMVGAISAAALSLYALLHLFLGGGRWQQHARAVGILVLGILTTSWWLLPSLVGGLVSQSGADYSQVIMFLSPAESFNPTLRHRNPEIFYWGLSLVPLLAYGLFTWAKRPVWSRAALASGLIFIVITFPFLRGLYLSLPLHYLLWPTRFASFASVIFLVGALPHAEDALFPSRRALTMVISASLIALLMLDGFGSTHLIASRRPNAEVEMAISQIPAQETARVAVLDQSSLGSPPSFLLSHGSGREQIFGWAWQGATTSPNLVWLNTALVGKHYAFLFDRLVEMGTTDIISVRTLVDQVQFQAMAAKFGFVPTWSSEELDLYRRPGGPYAVTASYKALAIGRYAVNLAYLFPQVEVGNRIDLDGYSLAELSHYETIVLAGPEWKTRGDAEKLIKDLVGAGVRVVVDMAGMPLGVLSKRPEFLGVYGEPISLGAASPGIQRNSGDVVILQPFPTDDGVWHTLIPQGIQSEDGFIHHFGAPTATFGTRTLPEGNVLFTGLNLFFHAARTRDPAAIRLLAEWLNLEPDAPPTRSIVPLTRWEPSDGASLALDVPSDAERLVIPIALLDSLHLYDANGSELNPEPVHNLIGLRLAPGAHDFTLQVTSTKWHPVGAAVSALAIGAALLITWHWNRRREELI